jgi:hypothetical protein
MFWLKKQERNNPSNDMDSSQLDEELINKVVKEWLDFELTKEIKGFSDSESILEWLNASLRYQLISHINSSTDYVVSAYFDLATLCMHAVQSIVRDHFASADQFESIMLETAGYHHQLLDRLETRQRKHGFKPYISDMESLGYLTLAFFNIEGALNEEEYGVAMNSLMDMCIECLWAVASKKIKN